jgi:HEAT repeat protein
VAFLVPKLANPRLPTDSVAGDALRGLAPEAGEAVPILISLLNDRRGDAAFCARLILKDLGPSAAPAVPSLVAILEEARAQQVPNSQSWTFEALGNIGPAAASAVPLLIALLEQPTDHADVISALGKIAPESPEVQSAIRRHLKGQWPGQRAAAVHALARPGNDSPQVLAEVVELLRNDPVENVRAQAAMAIAGLSGDRGQAVDPLTRALEDSDAHVRKMAAIALESMGPAAKAALPALQKAWLEARCGIPSGRSSGAVPTAAARRSFVLYRGDWERDQLTLAQALRRALSKIDGRLGCD